MATAVRELPLDLDAFEGPFDLLLTLVLREELELRDVDVAEIVLAFVERLAERDELDLEACGEFLVLSAALLELKARGLFPDEELDLEGLDPEEAAEELAERLAAYRRFRAAAAGWRSGSRRSPTASCLGAAPLAPAPSRPLAQQDPAQLVVALRSLAAVPPEPSLRHLVLSYPPLSRFLDRFRNLLRARGRFAFDNEVDRLAHRADRRLPRPPRAAQAGRPRSPRQAPSSPSRYGTPPPRREPRRPLARTIEALLVIASKPLSVAELAAATEEDQERVETALGLIASRFREGRSGIVLEHVAGGYAYVRRGRRPTPAGASSSGRCSAGSQAALETLAIVAYLGPVSRPEIARIRGVAADSAVAGLVERGLIAEAGREEEGGAVRYETTPLFERVFGWRAPTRPELDELAGDVEELRTRLEDVARRPA